MAFPEVNGGRRTRPPLSATVTPCRGGDNRPPRRDDLRSLLFRLRLPQPDLGLVAVVLSLPEVNGVIVLGAGFHPLPGEFLVLFHAVEVSAQGLEVALASVVNFLFRLQ